MQIAESQAGVAEEYACSEKANARKERSFIEFMHAESESVRIAVARRLAAAVVDDLPGPSSARWILRVR